MNVREIIEGYLKDNGFDGLFDGDAECACEVGELAPCDSINLEDCEPGYKVPCDCGDHDWHIQPGKPVTENATEI